MSLPPAQPDVASPQATQAPQAAQAPPDPAPAPGLLRLLVVLLVLLGLGVTSLVALSAVRRMGRPVPPRPAPSRPVPGDGLEGGAAPASLTGAPPVLRILEPFSVTERTGQTLTLDALRGRVWVAGFIFTRCPGICPLVMARMAALRERLAATPSGSRVTLLCFSVDPAYDTPEVLAAFAERFRADPERWLFATGPRERLRALIRDNFKLAVEDAAPDASEPIIHSPNLMLVDDQGRVRGYYNSLDESARELLETHLTRVLAEPPTQPPTQPAP